MRKTLSILLSVVMVLSVLAMGVVGAGAAEGTAINTAEEFLAMAADGTYYLAADITVNETYVGKDAEGNAVAFTGTLDGNGHTVTVSVPMFKQMDGTVKDLTTVGEIKVEATVTDKDTYTAVGAVAAQSKGGQFSGITNKADITVTVTVSDAGKLQSRVGGIAGRLNGADTPATFTLCNNEGNITSDGSTGGIVGGSYCTNAVFDSCINKGTITNTSGISACFAGGGIVGYSGTGAIIIKNCINYGDVISACRAAGMLGDARKSATIENCTNNGKISLTETAKNDGGATTAGGIVGYALGGSCIVDLTVTGCVNNGEVVAYLAGSADGVGGGIVGYAAKSGDVKTVVTNCVNNAVIWGGNQAGGAIGYLYGSGSSYGTVTNFVNTGDIKAGKFASEFMAYSNQKSTVISNVVGTGKLVDLNENGDTGAHLCVIGLSSADVTKYTFENVFIADGNTATHFSWTATADNAASVIEISAVDGKALEGSETVKAFTRGELNAEFVSAANTAAGSEVFVLDNGTVSLKEAVGSTLVETPVVDPTPVDPVDPAPVPTGDAIVSVVAVAAISLVAVLGIAYTSKKEND